MGFSQKEAPNCDWCKVKKNCFYSLLGDKGSRREWREMRIANRFRSGESIFYEGETPGGVYICCSGQVKMYRSSRLGQQLLLRLESGGDLVGHISVLSGWPYASNAESMGESVVSMIPDGALKRFLLSHPEAALVLLREVARDVRRASARAQDIAFKPARARLAGTLIRMLAPESSKGTRPVVAALKRKELAEMAGLTIETTVRLIKDFETRRWLEKKGKDLILLDVEKLRTLSGQFS